MIRFLPYYTTNTTTPKYEMEGIKMRKENHNINLFIKEINKVEYRPPHTVVFWENGEVTHVKAIDEDFDAEKGLAMAILKYLNGNDASYYDVFKVFHRNREDQKAQKELNQIQYEMEKLNKRKAKIEKQRGNI